MNEVIKVTFEYGIVIRKESMSEKRVDRNKLLSALEVDSPASENDDLMTFGPHFGPESMENLGGRIESLGLGYIDDFFYFHGDFPDWAEFSVSLKLK